MEPVKYYQIMTPDNDGVLRPFETIQFPGGRSFYDTQEDAEEFIKTNLLDAQEIGSNPPIDHTDVVLIILPIFKCRFKRK
jgi:hypothetical protein